MKKKGFTLIELMVVIVIMGILAAVAVPKLFAMIAKSKAAEVGPIAGSYLHRQDVYIAEKLEIGDFEAIGFDIPPSTVFTYSETYTAMTKEIWTATPKAGKLSECSSDTWTVTSEIKSSRGKHIAATNCTKLTPNFTAIGSGS